MVAVNKNDTYLYFKKITKFDIQKLFGDFLYFINNHSPNIVGYYSLSSDFNANSFNAMFTLIKDTKHCLECFHISKKYFGTYEYWELLDNVESIFSKISIISNIGFFLRSPLGSNNYSGGNIEKEFLIKSTLEKFTLEELRNSNNENDWFKVALYNNLNEEDYKANEKFILKYVVPSDLNKTFLNVVLGLNSGEYLKGIDISKIIKFNSDINDIIILTPEETLQQSTDIKLNLKRGQIPEFPNDGVQKELFVGTNVASLNFPILFRQITNLFIKDDTFSSISIINAKYEKDALYIEFGITTTYGDSIKRKVKV
jgi:hypothetical protein